MKYTVNVTTRSDILDKAKHIITEDRNDTYGEPEESFEDIATLWNAYLFLKKKYHMCPVITSEDVGLMMVLFKIGRQITGEGKLDNYVDMAGYCACAGEIFDTKQDKQVILPSVFKTNYKNEINTNIMSDTCGNND